MQCNHDPNPDIMQPKLIPSPRGGSPISIPSSPLLPTNLIQGLRLRLCLLRSQLRPQFPPSSGIRLGAFLHHQLASIAAISKIRDKLTCAAIAAFARASSSPPPPPPPPAVGPSPNVLPGVPQLAFAGSGARGPFARWPEADGAEAEPRTRPGWAKASGSFLDLEQMFPIVCCCAVL